ncbi:MAG TPA: murein L,D-transpeptidase [Oxalobacteraceae bacterium]|nr:murein L,D-transpeptidase [Oxalobacteraceae bacterium]HCN91035.1 murein L,D-transpeptidase [Oxalobacteraceae bacterium]
MNSAKLALIAACLVSAAAAPSSFAAGVPLTIDAVNSAEQLKPVGAGKKNASVLRAQILLDRAHFSSGEIDGAYGSNMRQALAGYQRKNGLDVNATINTATWAALNADTAAALVPYTILDSDVAGPFNPVPEGMADKANMATLGFSSIDEALGEKFHISPGLMKRLNPGKDLMRAGEEIIVPNVLDTEPLPKARKIIVDKSDGTLTLIDTEGNIMAQYPATTGSAHDPLPLGAWKVKGISHNPVFRYNPKLFWDANSADKKATIPAGPNNPVGVAWVDLTKEHYGIHGTPTPSTIGKTQSHGCIRLTNWDVMSVTLSVSTGTEVLLQE